MKTGRHLNIRIGDDPAERVTRPPMSGVTQPPMHGYTKPPISEPKPRARNEELKRRVTGTPFLGIHFVNCQVYGRLYKNPEGTHYEGVCPKCRRRVKIRIGPEGSSTRTFKSYCD